MIPLLLACGSAPERPNVLLVSMDTVRFDRTSLGGDRDTTPNLAALAAEGVSFNRAYSVGNESLRSHVALFTGLYPSEVAVPDYGSFALPRVGAAPLAEVLAAYGYRTAAFTGGGHVVPAFGFDRGFASFAVGGGPEAFGSAFDSVPPAVAWMKAQGEAPWFAFVHGYDAHSPYAQRGPMRPLGAVPAPPIGSSGSSATPWPSNRCRATSGMWTGSRKTSPTLPGGWCSPPRSTGLRQPPSPASAWSASPPRSSPTSRTTTTAGWRPATCGWVSCSPTSTSSARW